MNIPLLFQNSAPEEREYFTKLAHSHQKELKLHESYGLWEKEPSGKTWTNVTEHCLIEAARSKVLSSWLNLPQDIRDSMESAAVVHDFYKKREIELVHEDIKAGRTGKDGTLKASDESEKIMSSLGFDDFVVSLVECVGATQMNLHRMKRMLDLKFRSDEDLAHLAIHYIDDYTIHSCWAKPAEIKEGKKKNDADRRNEKNIQNPDYKKMGAESTKLNQNSPYFKGMSMYESAVYVDHLIENEFAGIIRNHGITIGDPIDLPWLVDNYLRNKINKKRDLH